MQLTYVDITSWLASVQLKNILFKKNQNVYLGNQFVKILPENIRNHPLLFKQLTHFAKLIIQTFSFSYLSRNDEERQCCWERDLKART